MSRSQFVVFVLWSHYFEEAPAVLFITELRQAGLCVKVVGLRGAQAPGVHGVVLQPDLTLGQALRLVQRASCVVLPCPAKRIRALQNDPRLLEFFQQAAANGALCVLAQDEPAKNDAMPSPLACFDQILYYPTLETLLPFIQEVLCALGQRSMTPKNES
jgi:hypothetical protein